MKDANADAPAPKKERTKAEVVAIAAIAAILAGFIATAMLNNGYFGTFFSLPFVVWGKFAYDRARLVELTARLGHDAAVGIVKETFWRGMTYEMLVESIGRPEDIDTKVMKQFTRHVYKYNQSGKGRYRLRITLEDGIVVGWEQK